MKLKPCPFCGCSDVRIEPNGIGDYFAVCGDGVESGCGARTSDVSCESDYHAADRWNKRSIGQFVLRAKAGFVAFNTRRGDYFAPSVCDEVVRFSSALEAIGAAVLLGNGATPVPV